MKNKRFQFGDRRENNEMPKPPFKDSMGATIKDCRRRIPDRRLNNLQTEWIGESVFR